MSGIIRPSGAMELETKVAQQGRFKNALYGYRWFIGLVLLPTLVVAGYYYLIASDQYESQATFVVRKAGVNGQSGGVGQILGFSVGSSQAQSEARIIEEFLLSHDAVERLRKEDALVEKFRRDGTDMFSRLSFSDTTPEDLLKYYRKRVNVEFDADKGVSTLSVKAFSPEDALVLSRKLLSLGEEQVNAFNERTNAGEVGAAKRELEAAEKDMAEIQREMTEFRRTREDIDPAGTGKAQIGLVTELEASLAAQRARLKSIEGFISRSSPQYLSLAAQVRALEAQVAAQNSKLANNSGSKSIASRLGAYEELSVRQEFAGKRYVTAAAVYQQAVAEARKQQLYLVRVVEPNKPVKSLFPERGRIVLTLFFSLAIAYAIGWLMVAGVKEHALSS